MDLRSVAIDPGTLGTREGTTVYWLGNAGALIDTRGTLLLIDPVITMTEKEGQPVIETGHRLKVNLPIEAKDLARVDAVLYTHADGDHFGRMTAEVLEANLSPSFYTTTPVKERLVQLGVPSDRISVVSEGDSFTVGQVEVHVTPAMHDWNDRSPWKREDCCGFLIRTQDGTIWHPGDSRLLDELLEVKGVDVLFFDVAVCNAHLGPDGSAKLAQTSGASDLIGYHYGTLDVPRGGAFGSEPEDCMDLVAGLDATMHLLGPGEPLRLEKAGEKAEGKGQM